MSQRVTVVGPVPPLRGGIAHHTDELVRTLDAGGATVQVISWRRLYPRALFPGTSERDEASSAASAPARMAHALLVPWLPHTWLGALREISSFRPDVVIAPWWHAAFTPALAGVLGPLRARGARTVVIAHNARTHEQRAFDAAAWQVLRRVADTVVTHADGDAERLRGQGVARVLKLEHPPYRRFLHGPTRADARRALGIAPDVPVALLFGLLRAYKGVDVALAAAARARVPCLELLVVGEPYVSPDIVARWRGQASARVRLILRYVGDDEVAQVFAAADVLVASHVRASQSGVVQIARAAGLPVIGTDAGGLPETLRTELGDRVVPAGDEVALAGALEAFFAAPRPPRAPLDVDAAWRAYGEALLGV